MKILDKEHMDMDKANSSKENEVELIDTDVAVSTIEKIDEGLKLDKTLSVISYSVVKRSFDIFVSFVALVVLLIPMAIVAVVIMIDSPGASPIFSQERVGINGKVFKLYKFRSMIPNATAKLQELMDDNEMDGPVFKIKKDPRITKVGKYIRKFCIDELPQLWNVLVGDMSVVGPRPGLVREVEQYTSRDKQRLLVKPGLTCYWQTYHNKNDLSFDEWMQLDIKYIKERSIITDCKIIFKTFSVVFRGSGV